MKIDLKCSCGALATFEDSDGKYLHNGGREDSAGRVYRIERWADDWQEKHASCSPEKRSGA